MKSDFSHHILKANFYLNVVKKMELFDLMHILHLQQNKYRSLYTQVSVVAFTVVTLGRCMSSLVKLTLLRIFPELPLETISL